MRSALKRVLFWVGVGLGGCVGSTGCLSLQQVEEALGQDIEEIRLAETTTVDMKIFETNVELPFAFSATTEDCDPGSGIISFAEFTVPNGATEVEVKITGEDGSRTTVTVERITGQVSGAGQKETSCARDQTTGTNQFAFTPEAAGAWLIQFSEAGMPSVSYTICITAKVEVALR